MNKPLIILAFIFAGLSQTVSGAGRLVYMAEKANGQKNIIVADADGTNPSPLSRGDKWDLYPDIDPTGRWVAYVEIDPTVGTGRLLVQDTKQRIQEQWAEGKGMFLHPSFSGDGNSLAYSFPEKGVAKIGLIHLQNEREKTPGATAFKPDLDVIPSTFNSYFPQVSSDGSFVVFQRSMSKDHKDIVHYDRHSKKTTPISPLKGVSMAPALSFDDKWVAFTRKQNGQWDIFMTDWRAKKTIQITDHASRDFAPTFRPDGSLVFSSDRSGQFQLYEITKAQIEAGSFKVTTLVTGPDSYYAPAISGELSFAQKQHKGIPSPARSSFGAVRVGDRLYIAGGHQGNEHTYPESSFLDTLEYYDLKTNTWHQSAKRAYPCHGFGLATHKGYIYAFGGFAFSDKHVPGWKSLDVIERYDTKTDTWSVVGKLPRRRSSNVVAQLDGKAYLIAGWDSTPKKPKDFEGVFHRAIDVFDMETETVMTSQAVLPNPLRRALSGVVKGDEILLIGGLGQGASHFDLLDNVTAWNPAKNTWRELPRLPFATFAPATGLLDGDLFVFGGMFKTGPMAYEYVNHIFTLKNKQHAWEHTGRFLSETKGFSQVAHMSERQLAILGGHSYEGGDAPVATFESFAH